MFCPNCGKELMDGSAFCDGCGHKLGGAPSPANAFNPNQMMDALKGASSTPGKMNFIGLAGAGLLFISVFLPAASVFGYNAGNIFNIDFMGVLVGIVSIIAALLGAFASVVKNDQLAMTAGVVGVVAEIIALIYIPASSMGLGSASVGVWLGLFAAIALIASKFIRKSVPSLQ